MYNIITNLLALLQVQQKIISILFILVTSKPLKSNVYDKPCDIPYRKLAIDQLPIFDTHKVFYDKVTKSLDYTQLLNNYFTNTGKNLKPVSRRGSKIMVPTSLNCPVCGAPHDYIYVNNGGKGQYLCKVCKSHFNRKTSFIKEATLRCPHCGYSLDKIKERSCFFIHKCRNENCSFYLKNLNNLSKKEKEIYALNPEKFKLHYIYREFTTDFIPLSSQQKYDIPTTSLSRIHSSNHTLGLILTYHINYGLSARKTAALLFDVHGVKISHQTIINYSNMVSVILKPYIDNYPYEISDSIAGDETYIRVNGKWNYIFFFTDTVKKTILSYYTSPNRDTLSCITAIDFVLSKFKEFPKDLAFTVDGNPIYLLAQYWFASHGINFNINQVIGLKNNDETSKEFRPLKQAIERHNRSFKTNVRSSHGFGSTKGSVGYVTLFCTYFNFLRPHMALNYKTPVNIPELNKLPHMPAKWLKLIELSQNYILEHQEQIG